VFEKKHICIAHRGYRAKYPENTIIAFQKAIGVFDMFEFDVQFTKDGVAVVFHDEDLRRCSDVLEKYDKYKIHELTLEEIKNLDNVSWFIRKNPFDMEINYKELKKLPLNSIPTLEEVLKFIKKTSFSANLEIKQSVLNQKYIIKYISDMIEKYSLKEDILISSFNHSYLLMIEGFYTAALFETSKENLLDYLKKLNVTAYHISDKYVKDYDVKNLLDNGIYTNVYTVNDKKRRKELFCMGVKGVFCDYVS